MAGISGTVQAAVLVAVGATVTVKREGHGNEDQGRTLLRAVRPNGRYEGLVIGLADGANRLTASMPGAAGAVTITNHPIGGPVFAGTHRL